ncbi:MAG: phosphatase PAP2 family protein [Candidatus Zixiibacteriota bacterium]|jgi:undecaprenyl-diphosphatase
MSEILASLVALDKTIFRFVNQSLANPVTDVFMPFITTDLHLKIFYGVCLFLILWKGDRRLRWAVLGSLVVVTLSDQLSSAILKPLVGRLRPCKVMEVHLLVGCGSGFSFPSSHAANLFGQAFFFYGIAPRSAKFLVPLAALVALSRVFVGVHYPGDILAGAILGTAVGLVMAILFSKANRRFYSESAPGGKSIT